MVPYKINSTLINAIIVLNSFTLFLFEIYLGKYFLPYFGSGASVWNICLVFFTTYLFLAYIYAYFLSSLKLRTLFSVHLVLGLCVLAFGLYGYYALGWLTPVTINIPRGVFANPEIRLLNLLILSSGILFIFLGSTTILFQKIYHDIYGKDPYRFYALSNFGSFLGLFSFPFVFERYFYVEQTGFIVFYLILLSVLIYGLFVILNYNFAKKIKETELLSPVNESIKALNKKQIFYWIGISFLANALLVSITNYIAQEIYPFPLIWALILSAYLLSFMAGFRDLNKVSLRIMALVALFSIGLSLNLKGSIVFLVFIYLFLFFIFTILNNKLFSSKPNVKYLSSFYIYLVLGGALGTIIGSLIPPMVFNGYYEVPILLASVIIICFRLYFYSVKVNQLNQLFLRISLNLITIMLVAFLGLSLYRLGWPSQNDIFSDRNFYGSIRVIKENDVKYMLNGPIVHGIQVVGDNEPKAYYSKNTPVYQLISAMENEDSTLDIAVLGLGSGTLGYFCRDGNYMAFYEINPSSAESAVRDFDFLNNCQNYDIYMGDARVLLENQAKRKTFDVIVVDAFTGDAIPYHLLTVEAINLYQSILNEDGVIAFNISNKYLSLGSVIKGIAQENDLNFVVLQNEGTNIINPPSEWGIMTKNQIILDKLGTFYQDPSIGRSVTLDKSIVWTDSFNSILGVFK